MGKNTSTAVPKPGKKPDELSLRRGLAGAFPAYKELMERTKSYHQEWKFYGAKIGWQLKIARNDKALLYLTPLDGAFRIGLALREAERDALLSSSLSTKLKDEIRVAKRVSEGYPLRISVFNAADMKPLGVALDILMRMRQ